MNNRPYDSLRKKLVLPFVLLGFFVSVLLGLVTFGLVAELEESAIVRILQVEMENFQNRKAQDTAILPPATSVLAGFYLPAPGFPMVTPLTAEQDRIEQITKDNREYSVMITRVDGRPYALFYDRSYVAHNLGHLALFLLIAVTLMTLLSLMVGNHLAGKVVKPIGRLLDEISKKTAGVYADKNSPPGFSVEDYPSDEIGHLVRALDHFSVRLHGFLARESFFAGDVSHELRTPVAVIRGAAEVLVESPDLSDPVRQRLQTIHRQAVRMGQMLEAMLLLAREGREVDDLACAIAEVVEEVVWDAKAGLAGRPIQISFLAVERPILPVERSLAYVLVSNLLRNACAYTHEGSIVLRLDARHLEIEDSGIGIPEERFPLLFQRHAKGDESAGHGLGLSIVARIAEQLDWCISIQSSSGVGTKVLISFAE